MHHSFNVHVVNDTTNAPLSNKHDFVCYTINFEIGNQHLAGAQSETLELLRHRVKNYLTLRRRIER